MHHLALTAQLFTPGPNVSRLRHTDSLASAADLCTKPPLPMRRQRCRDNRLYLVSPSFVAAVHLAAPVDEMLQSKRAKTPAGAAALLKLALQDATIVRWTGRPFGHTASGSTATASMALRIAQYLPDPSDLLLAATGWTEAVEQGKESYRHAKKAYRQADRAVRDANRRRRQLGAAEGPAEKSLQLRARAKQLRQKVRGRQAEQGGVEWSDVLATVAVLEQFAALKAVSRDGEKGWYDLIDLGLIARDIRFENELWLAMILENDALEVRAAPSGACFPFCEHNRSRRRLMCVE